MLYDTSWHFRHAKKLAGFNGEYFANRKNKSSKLTYCLMLNDCFFCLLCLNSKISDFCTDGFQYWLTDWYSVLTDRLILGTDWQTDTQYWPTDWYSVLSISLSVSTEYQSVSQYRVSVCQSVLSISLSVSTEIHQYKNQKFYCLGTASKKSSR